MCALAAKNHVPDNLTNVYSFGSYMVPLYTSLSATNGPVMEIGGGLLSTHLLHFLCGCAQPARELYTGELNPAWYDEIKQYQSDKHQVELLTDLNNLPVDKKWSVVFLDGDDPKPIPEKYPQIPEKLNPNSEGYNLRKGLLLYMKQKTNAEIFVIHDSDHPLFVGDKMWQKSIEGFRYRWEFKMEKPFTLVLSDTIDVKARLKDSL